ncbi:MAG: helix-turn-helix transcriptional regulator [Acidobacteriota bacterium]
MEPWGYFGTALRLLRTKAGLTQREVQARTGIRSRTLSSYETGQRLPPMASFMSLLDGLGYGLLDFAAALRFAAGDPRPFRSDHWRITVHPEAPDHHRPPDHHRQTVPAAMDVRRAVEEQGQLARELLEVLDSLRPGEGARSTGSTRR